MADGGVTKPATLRAKVGRVAQRVIPDLDERQWNRKRDREMRALAGDGGYSARLDRLGWAQADKDRTPRLVIVPKNGPAFDNWRAAGGNFFYEIAQAAREYFGEDAVSLFSPEPDEPPADWHERLARHLIAVEATHLMAMVETDPDDAGTWTWDVLWSQLHTRWDGVFLGVMFDSAYRWITIPVRRLARMSPRFVVVDIAMPMDDSMQKGRVEVGPVNMPVSNESLGVIDAQVAALPKIHDVTFLGSLYPGRVAMLEELRSRGVRVAVNPHHQSGEVLDLEGSRANQPGYIGYMAALAQSHMTINFGRSSAGDYFQLKTRVLEAELMGCIILTDDVDRTERFWTVGEEFGYFKDPVDVPSLVESFLSDRDRMSRAQQAGRERARRINISSFWGGVEEGLKRRGLPTIGT